MAMTEAAPLTATEHARAIAAYSRAGKARTRALGNRRPIRFGADGKLLPEIIEPFGRPALGEGIVKAPYKIARPLSDPVGGTDKNNGRHPVRMLPPEPGKDDPEWVVELLDGDPHLMDECLPPCREGGEMGTTPPS